MSSLARKLRRARGRARGFTMVELLVALVAGLMVALAVVGLSKQATDTFHEETRIASAEMQLRTAVDRLRNDLSRAAYMSTGNLMTDPKLAAPPGQTSSIATTLAANYASSGGHMALSTLAGIHLDSTANSALTLSATNSVSPQAIELSGNFTTVESFPVGGLAGTKAIEELADQTSPGNKCSGQRIHVDPTNSPALWRALGLVGTSASTTIDASPGSTSYDATFLNLFAPVNGGVGGSGDSGSNSYPMFIVRFVDATGNVQFAATCDKGPAAVWNNGNPYVDIQSNTPIALASANKGGGGFAGVGGGVGTINPVQIVRWEILPSQLTDPMGGDADKYDLVRQWLDATGTVVGTEVVAEFAVDLAFAFTVDTTKSTDGNYSGGGITESVFAFTDVTNNQKYGDLIAAGGVMQPQRIRSVRVRLATRAAQPDRTAPLTAPGGYLYRYCASEVDGSPQCNTPGVQSWARTRTVTTEVALPNQARFWWQ